jgi:hypothetical protein
MLSLTGGDRGFESGFLQRRVLCEPHKPPAEATTAFPVHSFRTLLNYIRGRVPIGF